MTGLAGSQEQPLLESIQHRLLQWWEDRQRISRELREFRSLDEVGLHEIALDFGVSPDILAAVIRHGRHGAEEMPELMKALNIDSDAVRFDDPATFRELEVSCALCAKKNRCHHELKDGTAAENYTHFCANEAVMSELRAHPEFQAG